MLHNSKLHLVNSRWGFSFIIKFVALILTDQNFHSDNDRESNFRYRDFNINQGLISSDPLVTDFFAVREKLFNWFTVSRGSWFRDQDFGSWPSIVSGRGI